jgi:hypothetical protein
MSDVEVIDVAGVRYANYNGILLQLLADGTPGPAVGKVDEDGSVTLDEGFAIGACNDQHDGRQVWIDELVTATLPPITEPAAKVPDDIIAAIARGEPAEWRCAVDEATVARYRAAAEELDASGCLRRCQHKVCTFSKVSLIVRLYSKYSRALTFENL